MTRTTFIALTIAALTVAFTLTAAAQDAAEPEGPPASEDASAEAVTGEAESDPAATSDTPAVESLATAEAEAPAAAPPPPVPQAEPTADDGVVYAPSADANVYPAPVQTAPPPRVLWPHPGRFGFVAAYAPSIAVGSSADFASNFGYRGFVLGVRRMINEVFSVGIESGWALQDDKRRDTSSYQGETRTLTATTGQIRTTEIIPITAVAHYYYDAGSIVPHVGLGLGAYYTRRDLDAGLWYFSNDGWHFGFSPEVGILVPMAKYQVLLSARFNYIFEGGDMPEEMFFDFRIGLLGF